MPLPYPSISQGKEKINLESIEYKNASNFVYFSVTIALVNNPKQLTILPIGAMVPRVYGIQVLEKIPSGQLELEIGTRENPAIFGRWLVFQKGYSEPASGFDGVFKTVTEPTIVYLSMRGSNAGLNSSGRIIGLFEWINTNRIKRV